MWVTQTQIKARPLALPLGFEAPEAARLGRIGLRALIEAATLPDRDTLAAMRAEFPLEAETFDRFVAAIGVLAAGDPATAATAFAELERADWRVPAAILGALALAAAGSLGPAIALAHRTRDVVWASGMAGAAGHPADRALLKEGVRCLQQAEAPLPAPTGPVQVTSLFRYVVGYPRSGNTLLLNFLAYAFATPIYSAYPSASRYFSRRFHAREPGHAVFVKDHLLRPEYQADEILSPVRDGRIAIVSLARYLHAEGSNRLVRRGELADFMSFVAATQPYGFWSDHTRALLDARARGVRIRLVRYEDIFGNHPQLLALARELASGAPVPHEDEAGYAEFLARQMRRTSTQREWSEGIALPDDSFIPQNWSIGGETIDWHRSFDAAACRRFHELGGTDMLIRLGYESDEDWWRQA